MKLELYEKLGNQIPPKDKKVIFHLLPDFQ